MGAKFLGPGGLEDRGNVPYSDSNPPVSMERTIATEPATPPAGETVEWMDTNGHLRCKTNNSATVKPVNGAIFQVGGSAPADTTIVWLRPA